MLLQLYRGFELQLRSDRRLSVLDDSLQVGVVSQLHYGWPFLLPHLKTVQDQLFDFIRDIALELPPLKLLGHAYLQFLLSLTRIEGCFPVIHLINHNPKGPYVCLRPVDVVQDTLRRHVERRADVQILEIDPKYRHAYLEWSAKPKSAILATPLCMKILAILRSLCTIFLEAKYFNPRYTSAMILLISHSSNLCFLLILPSKSP